MQCCIVQCWAILGHRESPPAVQWPVCSVCPGWHCHTGHTGLCIVTQVTLDFVLSHRSHWTLHCHTGHTGLAHTGTSWPLLSCIGTHWHILAHTVKFFHILSIPYCHPSLSYAVTYWHILSHTGTNCHILSNTVKHWHIIYQIGLPHVGTLCSSL